MERTENTLYLPELAEYRKAVRPRQLAEAFCDLPESVCGCAVTQITPRTYSMLIASGCRFVTGGEIRIDDVFDFIWFHSPLYVHADDKRWRRRKRRALRPLTRKLWHPVLKLCRIRPKRIGQVQVVAQAIKEITALIESAFSCAGRGEIGKPALATLEAQLTHAFAKDYGWAPDYTRNQPLARLFQLDRCIAKSAGADVTDEGENRIIAKHLAAKNAKP